MEVYMDGGVRQGTDVLKALAPIARAFSTSVPCLTPPSMYTSTLPLTAQTTSRRASICTERERERERERGTERLCELKDTPSTS